MTRILSEGIPGTGMPAFRYLGEARVQQVVAYLRLLQGRSQTSGLTGDPGRGKVVFFGKGECSSCHMMKGEGGFLGPDLSDYALTRSANEILDAIVKPLDNGNANYVVAVTRRSDRVKGIIRNEDNFSVQLQTADGVFHFFSRAELQSIDHLPGSAMPGDYGKRLSQKELDDLISYVMGSDRRKPNLKSGDED